VLTRLHFGSVFFHAFTGILGLVVPLVVWADASTIQALLVRAQLHEKASEWDKAFAAYDDALKADRDNAALKERQSAVLRRYWQNQRHKDIGYQKEVLSLDYAQALRLNGSIFDTLLQSSLPKANISPGLLLKKGIEELEAALCDAHFAVRHLGQVRPGALSTFREYLARKKVDAAKLNRADCMAVVRDIALHGQSAIGLSPTVAIMEIACGACYAVDEYTAYLTPSQFRELTDSLKATLAPSVRYGFKNPDIGYLHIGHFQESTPQEVDNALFALLKSGMKGLILDLRGNPGGLVEAAIEVARRFLTSGVIASTENYDPKMSTIYQARNPAAWMAPLVLLVDGDTASAAEVLAGALKDNARARLLGQPTLGKGSSQGLVKLPDAIGGIPTGGLRLTIARIFSPKGLAYAKQRIIPDLLLEPFKPDGVVTADPHVLAAQLELQRQLAAGR
jgi:hypothetical protein